MLVIILYTILLPIRQISSDCNAMFLRRKPGSPSYQIDANNCCTLGCDTNCYTKQRVNEKSKYLHLIKPEFLRKHVNDANWLQPKMAPGSARSKLKTKFNPSIDKVLGWETIHHSTTNGRESGHLVNDCTIKCYQRQTLLHDVWFRFENFRQINVINCYRLSGQICANAQRCEEETSSISQPPMKMFPSRLCK